MSLGMKVSLGLAVDGVRQDRLDARQHRRRDVRRLEAQQGTDRLVRRQHDSIEAGQLGLGLKRNCRSRAGQRRVRRRQNSHQRQQGTEGEVKGP